MKNDAHGIQDKTHRALLRCRGLSDTVGAIYEDARGAYGESGRVDNFFIAMINLREAVRHLILAEENLGNEDQRTKDMP